MEVVGSYVSEKIGEHALRNGWGEIKAMSQEDQTRGGLKNKVKRFIKKLMRWFMKKVRPLLVLISGNQPNVDEVLKYRLRDMIKYTIYRLHETAVNLFRVANFLNMVVFLTRPLTFYGSGRCLSESLLGIKLIKNNPNLERNLLFEFINRLIVWAALSKSIVNFLPILSAGGGSVF